MNAGEALRRAWNANRQIERGEAVCVCVIRCAACVEARTSKKPTILGRVHLTEGGLLLSVTRRRFQEIDGTRSNEGSSILLDYMINVRTDDPGFAHCHVHGARTLPDRDVILAATRHTDGKVGHLQA